MSPALLDSLFTAAYITGVVMLIAAIYHFGGPGED